MDPDENLRQQLELAAKIAATFDICDGDGECAAGSGSVDDADVDRLAELVLALNYWITNGGALPAAWRK